MDNEKHEELKCYKYFYNFSDEDSLGIETCILARCI